MEKQRLFRSDKNGFDNIPLQNVHLYNKFNQVTGSKLQVTGYKSRVAGLRSQISSLKPVGGWDVVEN